MRSPAIFPDRYYCKLNFQVDVVVSTGAASWELSTALLGNSLFEPMASTHQPTGFDQLSALYKQYCVMGSKISARVTSTQLIGATQNTLLCGPEDIIRAAVVPYNASTLGTVNNSEVPYVRMATVAPAGSGDTTTKTIKHYMSTAKIFGTKDVMGDDQYAAVTTANPAKIWYWVLRALNVSGRATLNTTIQCRVTYYAWFFDRKVFNVS